MENRSKHTNGGINLGTLFWLWSARRGMPLSQETVVFGMLNLVFETLAGILLFRERLAPVQWSGVALSLVAIALIGG